jgi:hypothetical protein
VFLWVTPRLSLEAVFPRTSLLKGPEADPGDRLDFSSDLGTGTAALRTGIDLDVSLRQQSGFTLGASFLSEGGQEDVGEGGLTYHFQTFSPGTRISALWETWWGRGALFYIFSPFPHARVRAELGLWYFRSTLVVRRRTTDVRTVETTDVFVPFLGFQGSFRLSSSVTLEPRLKIGYFWLSGDKYSQQNVLLDLLLPFAIPLSDHLSLILSYRLTFLRAVREDRGVTEELRNALHGPGVGLSLDVG